MSPQQAVQDLSFPVKIYVGIVHLLLLFLVVLFLQRPRKNGYRDAQEGRKSRKITKDNRAVTIEPCEWINSTLAWFYLHAQSDENKDRTPLIVKLWLRALNKQLLKDQKKDQRIVIEGLSPGCLPPKLTSVYCLCISGNMQCITFHVESADLGFLVQVLRQTDNGPKSTQLETRVVKLTGEVALKLNTAPSRVEVSMQFIGNPEITMTTKCLKKDCEVDSAEVQEKVKEVICKTITTLPLTADTTSKEKISSDLGSATSKEKLNSPSSVSCCGEDGKLLVKVIKASGLCGKDKSGPISPYCIVSTSNPLQRKRTSMVRDNESPFWNEYFTFDVTPKTKQISLDIYDYEKTDKDCNGHMNDSEFAKEQDDYLGQVIVPLSTVNRDQTCRLVLPVLPKSSNSEHSRGDISLEFTFDKDGKVFDATLPMVCGIERKVVSTDAEKPSAQSTPSEESPSVLINGVGSGVVNGHIPVRKRYFKSSLDELAMELEAYEHGEQRPKAHDDHVNDTHEPEELHTEPDTSPVVIATEVAETSRETEQMEDESERAIVELLKLSGEEVPEESNEEKKESESESETEEKKVEEKEKKEEREVADEERAAEELEERAEEPNLKPKHRRSFNLFKRKKPDRKEEKEEENSEEKQETGEETEETERKGDISVEGRESQEEVKPQDQNVDKGLEAKEEEKVDEDLELDRKQKTRRSFNLFRKRPKSMAASDKETTEEDEGRGSSRHDPVRHSYHAGDLTPDVSHSHKEENKEHQTDDSKVNEVQPRDEKETKEHETREEEEKLDEASELNRKPKMRHSFNLRFRRRPKSMAAADKETEEDGEEKPLSRHDPVRHSYHAGDLPVPDPSNLRKSTSQSSLLSYSPNPFSTLIIETVSKGQKEYKHIPPVMANRGAYERGGNKLHIYNDHIFQAVHFSGSSPDCAVCGKLIRGKVGKQGYQCRGCKMVTHRDCHYETTAMCTSEAVKHMNIEYVGDTEV